MANQAVVGLLRALLTVDPTTWVSGFKKASTSADEFKKAVKGVETETLRAGKSVEGMARSLGGTKLLQTANDLTLAVQKVGGAAKLTDAEKARLNTTISKAIDKYTALGKVAPQAMQDLERATRRVEQPTNTLSTKAVAVGAAIGSAIGNVAVGAVAKLGQEMLTAASKGVQLASLVTSFDRLAAGIGETGDAMLGVTRGATKGLIADLNIMQSANKAMLLGLPVTSGEMAKLAQTAVVLGKAMGQDATKSLEDLIVALGRSSPMILDNLGLTVKVGEANEKYAATLGKSAAALTDAEKKTAFYRAAMEAADAKTAQLGGIQLTLSDQLSRVTTGIGNIVTGWTRHLAQRPGLDGFLEGLGNKLNSIAAALDVASEAQRRFNALSEEERRRRAFRGEGPEAIEEEILIERSRNLVRSGRPTLQMTAPVPVSAFNLDEGLIDFFDRRLTKAPAAAVKAMEEANEKTKKLIADMRQFAEEQFRALAGMTAMIPQIGQMPAALRQENAFGPFALPGAFNPRNLPFVTPGGMPGNLPDALRLENMLGTAGPAAGFNFSGFMKGNLGNTILGSIMGGGDITKSLGSLVGTGLTSKLMGGAVGGTITKSLTGMLGKTIGSSIAGMIPGLGAIAGPLMEKAFGAIAGLFGGEGRKTNRQRDSWIKELTGVEDLPEAQDALRKMAAEAGIADSTVQRLFDAKRVKEFEAVAKQVTSQLALHQEREQWVKKFTGIEDIHEAKDELRRMATEAGITEETIRRLYDARNLDEFHEAQRLITDQIRLQGQLTDAQAQRMKMLEEAVERYGFEQSELGPGLRKQRLAEHAEELITDWKLLAEAGFDINTMAKRMADSVNAFIREAIRTGTDVPAAMRPMLEAMQRQGLLTDEAGDAIIDFEDAGIHFGETLTEMFQGVLQKLDELIDDLRTAIGLARDAERAANDAAQAGSGLPSGGGEGPAESAESFHRGGIVAHAGRFIGRGLRGGEVMVRALSGEGFLNRMATSALGGKPMIDAMNRGQWGTVVEGLSGLAAPSVAGGAGAFEMSAPSVSLSNAGMERRLDAHASELRGIRADLQRVFTVIPIEISAAMMQGRARG